MTSFCFLFKQSFLTVFLSIVAAFMKQRKMGLNDFIQRLATNSYACKQWVPSDSCYCSAFTAKQNIEKQAEIMVTCPLDKLFGLIWLPVQLIHRKGYCYVVIQYFWCFVIKLSLNSFFLVPRFSLFWTWVLLRMLSSWTLILLLL